MFPDKLDLVSQELVKLAKDNGSSDNISIVVVFLKPIEELAAMELPIDTKDLDTISQNGTNNMMNNNEKEALYDGITSTSIYVGKNSIEVRLFQTAYLRSLKKCFGAIPDLQYKRIERRWFQLLTKVDYLCDFLKKI